MSRRRRTGSVKAAGSVDALLGRNIRLHRLVGQSQANLANGSSVMFQQVRLAQAFARINDRDLRRSVVARVETLAARCAD